jgi:hypothetical protein
MFDNDRDFDYRVYSNRRSLRSLGEAITRFMRNNPTLAQQLTLELAKEIWFANNTETILKATGEISLYKAVLYIQIFNPSLRANLTNMRETICTQFNEQMEYVKIREVKFV